MTNQFYTTALFQTDISRYRNVWLITRKDEKYSVADYKNEQPTHVFVKGKGHVKITDKFEVKFIEKPQEIKNYDDVYNLIQKYGYEAAGKLLGFDTASFGDIRPFRELYYFEKLGGKYLNWLTKLAKIDGKMLEFFQSRGLVVKNHNYDMWILGKDICRFRKNPFLGWNMESDILGFPFEKPSLNVISIHDRLYPILDRLGVKNVLDMSLLDMLKYMGIEADESIVGLDLPA